MKRWLVPRPHADAVADRRQLVEIRRTELLLISQSVDSAALHVECYAGYRGDQEPLALGLGERPLFVRAVVDRRFALTQRWFKVDAEDGNTYVLRHDEASGDWELAAYASTVGRHDCDPSTRRGRSAS